MMMPRLIVTEAYGIELKIQLLQRLRDCDGSIGCCVLFVGMPDLAKIFIARKDTIC